MIIHPQIFLAPVSSTELYENYKRTVLYGIDNLIFFSYENTNQYKKHFLKNSFVRIWGIKNSKIAVYNKANINDVVLFYHKGYMVGRSTIFFKDKNQKLSDKLWGHEQDKFSGELEYWENLLFLEKFSEIKIDFNVFIKHASYKPKMSVRGFNEYSQIGMFSIINQYGTVEEFLNSF